MEEPTLLKTALSFSLFGLVILFFLANNIKVEEAQLQNLTNIQEDATVRLKGVATYVDDNGKLIYLKIAQPHTIDILVFKSSNLTLHKGDFLEVQGTISEYKGKPEIIATKISILG